MHKEEPAATYPKTKEIIRIITINRCFGNRRGRKYGYFSSEKGYELFGYTQYALDEKDENLLESKWDY